ncbi:MAG TPA: hypothetical protein VK253_06060 [Candidatus Binatia bacterium]|nr:hypothetical protein [Candidatus Binatia bacterium]
MEDGIHRWSSFEKILRIEGGNYASAGSNGSYGAAESLRGRTCVVNTISS